MGDIMNRPMHIVLGLWNTHKNYKEEEAKEQKKQEGTHSVPNMPSVSSMMSQAGRATGNVKMPSGMPNLSSFKP
jgi:hypothetical protein